MDNFENVAVRDEITVQGLSTAACYRYVTLNGSLYNLQAFLTLIRQMSRIKKGLAADEEDEDVKKRGPCCVMC